MDVNLSPSLLDNDVQNRLSWRRVFECGPASRTGLKRSGVSGTCWRVQEWMMCLFLLVLCPNWAFLWSRVWLHSVYCLFCNLDISKLRVWMFVCVCVFTCTYLQEMRTRVFFWIICLSCLYPNVL